MHQRAPLPSQMRVVAGPPMQSQHSPNVVVQQQQQRRTAGAPPQVMQSQMAAQARAPPQPMPGQIPAGGQAMMTAQPMAQPPPAKRPKRQAGDKLISPQVRQLVPESQAYMDLLAFENKLDATIARKKLDIQEALKRPMKVKRRLRIFVSHTFTAGKQEAGDSD